MPFTIALHSSLAIVMNRPNKKYVPCECNSEYKRINGSNACQISGNSLCNNLVHVLSFHQSFISSIRSHKVSSSKP